MSSSKAKMSSLLQNGRRFGEFGEKMHRFNQILGSKYFLLTFIRTMEKQPQEFGMTDRWASLNHPLNGHISIQLIQYK